MAPLPVKGRGAHDGDHDDEIIKRAYPNAPRPVREAAAMRMTCGDDVEELASEGFRDTRRLLHKLLGQGYDGDEIWLVETLELERQSVAAHLAAALEHEDQRPLQAV